MNLLTINGDEWFTKKKNGDEYHEYISYDDPNVTQS